MINALFAQSELKGFVLLYLTDSTCPVCDVFWPIIEKAALTYPELSVKAVDKQSMPQLAGQLLAFQFPTAIVFYQGKEVKRFVGAFAFDAFESHLADLIERLGGLEWN